MPKKRRRGKEKTFAHNQRYWVRLQNIDEVQESDQQLARCRQHKNNGNNNVPATLRKDNRANANNTNEQSIKETMVILKIPSAVITQVISNIEEIERLAEKNKIPIRGTQSLIKEIKFDNWSETVKSELVKIKEEVRISLLGPSTSCTSFIKTEHPQKTKPSGLKRPSAESIDFVSFRTDTKEKIRKITEVNHPSAPNLETVKTKTEPIDEIDSPCDVQALEVPVPLKEVKLEQDFTPIQVKMEPTDDIQYTGSINIIPKASIGDYQPQILDFIPVKNEPIESKESIQQRELLLRDGAHYKYGYRDIITESFQEKLDENLAKGITICKQTAQTEVWNNIFLEDYNDMITRTQFKEIMTIREKLPTFKRASEVLDIVNNNQVVIICGETGCGKSTQVPQIILDDAICKGKGANTHILVTQPRRIAASSLAIRVAQERAEDLGNCVGYAMRLEKQPARCRGSIMYVTTGVLLAELEMRQGLTQYSHIILDEVHERDTNIDFSMCLLKQGVLEEIMALNNPAQLNT